MNPTASIIGKDVSLQQGATYSLGSLLEYSEAGNTGDAITDASLTLSKSDNYSLSGTFVPGGVPSPFYGYVIKGTVDTGSQPAWGSLTAGSLTVPTDYVGDTLALSGWYQLQFLNSDANNAPYIVSYSFSCTFSVGPGALFTTGADQVRSPGQRRRGLRRCSD
jgi:hypothetical protein